MAATAHELEELFEMQFTEVKGYIGIAEKIKTADHIKYKLWFDENNKLYVQMVENEDGGSFSTLAFSVVRYAPRRHSRNVLKGLEGYNLITGKLEERNDNEEDNNNGAFLKAVLRHLCSGKDMSDDLLSLLSDKLSR